MASPRPGIVRAPLRRPLARRTVVWLAILLSSILLAGCVTRVTPASTVSPGGGQPLTSGTQAAATRTPPPGIRTSITPPDPAVIGPVALESGAVKPAPGDAVAGATGEPSLARLVGQKLVVAMQGTTPSAALLERIRRGRIGGVILFGSHMTTRSAVRTLTATLQAAAAAGGQPPLLIGTDQEGGPVKRIRWAPPTLSPAEMGAIGRASVARDEGAATGDALLRLGINTDFAPVADVPKSTKSFMYRQGRTWSFDAAVTARLSDAFARGLRSEGVVPAMKHFPGIGRAKLNTDLNDVTLGERAGRGAELEPYRLAVEHSLPMIMLSNATYPAYDPANAAGWSRAVVHRLLRGELGFEGVTITDSLSGISDAMGVPARVLAVRAAIAGTDMILISDSEASTDRAYNLLLSEARAGAIPRARLQRSYDRILALKAAF